MALRTSGRARLARFALEQGLTCSPYHWGCLNKLLKVLVSLDDWQAAHELAAYMLHLAPTHGRARQVLAMANEVFHPDPAALQAALDGLAARSSAAAAGDENGLDAGPSAGATAGFPAEEAQEQEPEQQGSTVGSSEVSVQQHDPVLELRGRSWAELILNIVHVFRTVQQRSVERRGLEYPQPVAGVLVTVVLAASPQGGPAKSRKRMRHPLSFVGTERRTRQQMKEMQVQEAKGKESTLLQSAKPLPPKRLRVFDILSACFRQQSRLIGACDVDGLGVAGKKGEGKESVTDGVAADGIGVDAAVVSACVENGGVACDGLQMLHMLRRKQVQVRFFSKEEVWSSVSVAAGASGAEAGAGGGVSEGVKAADDRDPARDAERLGVVQQVSASEVEQVQSFLAALPKRLPLLQAASLVLQYLASHLPLWAFTPSVLDALLWLERHAASWEGRSPRVWLYLGEIYLVKGLQSDGESRGRREAVGGVVQRECVHCLAMAEQGQMDEEGVRWEVDGDLWSRVGGGRAPPEEADREVEELGQGKGQSGLWGWEKVGFWVRLRASQGQVAMRRGEHGRAIELFTWCRDALGRAEQSIGRSDGTGTLPGTAGPEAVAAVTHAAVEVPHLACVWGPKGGISVQGLEELLSELHVDCVLAGLSGTVEGETGQELPQPPPQQQQLIDMMKPLLLRDGAAGMGGGAGRQRGNSYCLPGLVSQGSVSDGGQVVNADSHQSEQSSVKWLETLKRLVAATRGMAEEQPLTLVCYKHILALLSSRISMGVLPPAPAKATPVASAALEGSAAAAGKASAGGGGRSDAGASCDAELMQTVQGLRDLTVAMALGTGLDSQVQEQHLDELQQVVAVLIDFAFYKHRLLQEQPASQLSREVYQPGLGAAAARSGILAAWQGMVAAWQGLLVDLCMALCCLQHLRVSVNPTDKVWDTGSVAGDGGGMAWQGLLVDLCMVLCCLQHLRVFVNPTDKEPRVRSLKGGRGGEGREGVGGLGANGGSSARDVQKTGDNGGGSAGVKVEGAAVGLGSTAGLVRASIGTNGERVIGSGQGEKVEDTHAKRCALQEIEGAMDQCFLCLYGVQLRGAEVDVGAESSGGAAGQEAAAAGLVRHENTLAGELKSKDQCARALRHMAPFAASFTIERLVKLVPLLTSIHSFFPSPPPAILARHSVEPFLDDPQINDWGMAGRILVQRKRLGEEGKLGGGRAMGEDGVAEEGRRSMEDKDGAFGVKGKEMMSDEGEQINRASTFDTSPDLLSCIPVLRPHSFLSDWTSSHHPAAHHSDSSHAMNSDTYADVYNPLFAMLARIEPIPMGHHMPPGFFLEPKGHSHVLQVTSPLLADLCYHPSNTDSWLKLALFYDEASDLMLNDGAKMKGPAEWHAEEGVLGRLQGYRQRCMRCLVEAIATPGCRLPFEVAALEERDSRWEGWTGREGRKVWEGRKESEVWEGCEEQRKRVVSVLELLAFVVYDSIQNVVPSYDRLRHPQVKDDLWLNRCRLAFQLFRILQSLSYVAPFPNWQYPFFQGKLAEKLHLPASLALPLMRRAVSLRPNAVDTAYRLHASRLKALARSCVETALSDDDIRALVSNSETKDALAKLLQQIEEDAKLGGGVTAAEGSIARDNGHVTDGGERKTENGEDEGVEGRGEAHEEKEVERGVAEGLGADKGAVGKKDGADEELEMEKGVAERLGVDKGAEGEKDGSDEVLEMESFKERKEGATQEEEADAGKGGETEEYKEGGTQKGGLRGRQMENEEKGGGGDGGGGGGIGGEVEEDDDDDVVLVEPTQVQPTQVESTQDSSSVKKRKGGEFPNGTGNKHLRMAEEGDSLGRTEQGDASGVEASRAAAEPGVQSGEHGAGEADLKGEQQKAEEGEGEQLEQQGKKQNAPVVDIQQLRQHWPLVWQHLFQESEKGMRECLEGDFKHFHRGRYCLAKAYLRRGAPGDLERAKSELGFCFRKAKVAFAMNMWEICIHTKHAPRPKGGSKGARVRRKVVGLASVEVAESSRKFMTSVRLYLMMYLRLCCYTGDVAALEGALSTLKTDKEFSTALVDLVPLALALLVLSIHASAHPTSEQTTQRTSAALGIAPPASAIPTSAPAPAAEVLRLSRVAYVETVARGGEARYGEKDGTAAQHLVWEEEQERSWFDMTEWHVLSALKLYAQKSDLDFFASAAAKIRTRAPSPPSPPYPPAPSCPLSKHPVTPCNTTNPTQTCITQTPPGQDAPQPSLPFSSLPPSALHHTPSAPSSLPPHNPSHFPFPSSSLHPSTPLPLSYLRQAAACAHRMHVHTMLCWSHALLGALSDILPVSAWPLFPWLHPLSLSDLPSATPPLLCKGAAVTDKEEDNNGGAEEHIGLEERDLEGTEEGSVGGSDSEDSVLNLISEDDDEEEEEEDEEEEEEEDEEGKDEEKEAEEGGRRDAGKGMDEAGMGGKVCEGAGGKEGVDQPSTRAAGGVQAGAAGSVPVLTRAGLRVTIPLLQTRMPAQPAPYPSSASDAAALLHNPMQSQSPLALPSSASTKAFGAISATRAPAAGSAAASLPSTPSCAPSFPGKPICTTSSPSPFSAGPSSSPFPSLTPPRVNLLLLKAKASESDADRALALLRSAQALEREASGELPFGKILGGGKKGGVSGGGGALGMKRMKAVAREGAGSGARAEVLGRSVGGEAGHGMQVTGTSFVERKAGEVLEHIGGGELPQEGRSNEEEEVEEWRMRLHGLSSQLLEVAYALVYGRSLAALAAAEQAQAQMKVQAEEQARAEELAEGGKRVQGERALNGQEDEGQQALVPGTETEAKVTTATALKSAAAAASSAAVSAGVVTTACSPARRMEQHPSPCKVRSADAQPLFATAASPSAAVSRDASPAAAPAQTPCAAAAASPSRSLVPDAADTGLQASPHLPKVPSCSPTRAAPALKPPLARLPKLARRFQAGLKRKQAEGEDVGRSMCLEGHSAGWNGDAVNEADKRRTGDHAVAAVAEAAAGAAAEAAAYEGVVNGWTGCSRTDGVRVAPSTAINGSSVKGKWKEDRDDRRRGSFEKGRKVVDGRGVGCEKVDVEGGEWQVRGEEDEVQEEGKESDNVVPQQNVRLEGRRQHRLKELGNVVASVGGAHGKEEDWDEEAEEDGKNAGGGNKGDEKKCAEHCKSSFGGRRDGGEVVRKAKAGGAVDGKVAPLRQGSRPALSLQNDAGKVSEAKKQLAAAATSAQEASPSTGPSLSRPVKPTSKPSVQPLARPPAKPPSMALVKPGLKPVLKPVLKAKQTKKATSTPAAPSIHESLSMSHSALQMHPGTPSTSHQGPNRGARQGASVQKKAVMAVAGAVGEDTGGKTGKLGGQEAGTSGVVRNSAGGGVQMAGVSGEGGAESMRAVLKRKRAVAVADESARRIAAPEWERQSGSGGGKDRETEGERSGEKYWKREGKN
ncbi:unnamed protein product [Closterium sp. Naga37s-1]|nr:unnamed protein product [Closterium sp. Naga37s-1]